jgi:3-hydroxybutyryl-CoA dehydrogenase
MDIRKVAVIGAGTMGNGIAQVFSTSGYDTLMIDVKEELLTAALGKIRKSLEKLVEKAKLSTEEKDAALGRLSTSTKLEDAAGADLVVEAVNEDPALKRTIFAKLDEICAPETIFATNTSSISITQIGAFTRRPQKVAGMHFMNPVPLMKLVEVIRGEMTAPEVVDGIVDLCKKLGKTPVEANDFPGFIANRILLPMINEAAYALMEGVGTKEAIDTVMKLGANHPMGPLELADLIGLDVCLAIMEVLHQGLGDAKYRPCPLLRRMVVAGRLGRKAGQGFYTYQ